MTLFRKIAALTFFLVIVGSLDSFAQRFPPTYKGELDVCSRVAAGLKEGKSVESALVDLFLVYSDQPTQLYRSIQRTIIHNAIQVCHFEGTEVIGAALRIDMNLPLLVLSLVDAGVNPQSLRDALQQAGLDRPRIDEAFEVAGMEAQIPSTDYTSALPAPFEIYGGGSAFGGATGGGLGQASPFMP
ncbi:MAG: hypothetical protein HY203_05885 [Nitrospirae bacterium]|nr:hypothetical protein [Nitrospirota bacterium]